MPQPHRFLTTGPAQQRPDDDRGIDRVPRPVASRARELPQGHLVEAHHHRRAQLLFASRGTMVVPTDQGIWVVPTQRAVWIPAFVDHAVLARSQLSLRSLYFSPSIIPDMPKACAVVTVSELLRQLILAAVALPAEYDEDGAVVTVSELLRQLILAAVALPAEYDEDGADGRLIGVLLDQIQTLPETPLHLPMPTDSRLRVIAETLSKNPADPRSLEQWADSAGASSRTLTRLFAAETGMTFRQWRQQVRLLEALTRLADGDPVTTVALDLGYDSQSAFISMFRKSLGTTPGRYFAEWAGAE